MKHSEKRFLFWQQWLFYSSLLFAGFGIVLALFGKSQIFSPYNKMLAETFWSKEVFPDGTAEFRNFILGPLGGTIACCYVLVAFIAHFPFRKKERWARNAIIVAFLFWFILDSGVALFYGVYFHVLVINMFSLVIKALPLIFTWRHFNTKKSR